MKLDWFQISYEILSLCSFLSLLCILGLYLRHLKLQPPDEREKEEERNSKLSNVIPKIPWLPLCNIFCFVMYAVNNFLAVVEMYAGTWLCRPRVVIFGFCLGMSHFSMFNLYVLRVDLIFRESAFGYSTKFLMATRVFFLVTMVMFSTLLLRNVTGIKTTLSDCTFSSPLWYEGLFALFVVIVDFFCLALFLSPLFKVLRTSLDDRFRFVAVKCTVLTCVSVVSALFGIVGAAVGVFHLSRIDDVVECICLLLMNNTYKNWYERLCCGCIVCCKPPLQVVENGILISTEQLSNSTRSSPRSTEKP